MNLTSKDLEQRLAAILSQSESPKQLAALVSLRSELPGKSPSKKESTNRDLLVQSIRNYANELAQTESRAGTPPPAPETMSRKELHERMKSILAMPKSPKQLEALIKLRTELLGKPDGKELEDRDLLIQSIRNYAEMLAEQESQAETPMFSTGAPTAEDHTLKPGSRDELYRAFAAGQRPTGDDFAQLIDSFLHIRDDRFLVDKSDPKLTVFTFEPGSYVVAGSKSDEPQEVSRLRLFCDDTLRLAVTSDGRMLLGDLGHNDSPASAPGLTLVGDVTIEAAGKAANLTVRGAITTDHARGFCFADGTGMTSPDKGMITFMSGDKPQVMFMPSGDVTFLGATNHQRFLLVNARSEAESAAAFHPGTEACITLVGMDGHARGFLVAPGKERYSADASATDLVLRSEDGKLLLQVGGGASAIAIHPGNNVGIGTGSAVPKAKLEVQGRIRDQTGPVMPVGSILAFGGANSPDGWKLCDGSDISAAMYADLRSVLGRNNVPDLRGRTLVGAGLGPGLSLRQLGEAEGEELHFLSEAEMPAHSHLINNGDFGVHNRSFKGEDNNDLPFKTQAGNIRATNNAGSGKAHNNMQPYAVVNYIIKF